MTMSTDRYNKAARDGYLDALKEATRKDLNSHDEDGMTPTLWAAFEGNVDALRLIVGRGGDPDKCDNYGNTALHFAAARGHLNCVSFLANFGVNFWALDIDLHTPKDLAAINNKNEILCYLDSVIAKVETKDKKKVKALKEKAEKDAAKRIKEFDKLQKRASKNLEEEHKKLEKKREKMLRTGSIENGNLTNNTNGITNLTNQTGFLSIRNKEPLGIDGGSSSNNGNTIGSVGGGSKKFSDLVGNNKHNNGPSVTVGSQKIKLPIPSGVYRKVQQRKTMSGRTGTTTSDFTIGQVEPGGKRSVRSLSGLQRDSEIMYVPKYELTENNPGRRGKISGLFNGNDSNNVDEEQEEEDGETNDDGQQQLNKVPLKNNSNNDKSQHLPPHSTVSIFERPGFGSVAFRHTNSLNNFNYNNTFKRPDYDEVEEETAEYEEEEESIHQRQQEQLSSSSRQRSTNSGQEEVWDDIDVPVSDNESEEPGNVELFLTAAGLQPFVPVFLREKLELDALMELTETQLQRNFGMDTITRQKFLTAVEDRREAIENPGEVYDSRL